MAAIESALGTTAADCRFRGVESASYDIGLTITDDVYGTIIKKATPGQRVAAGVQGVLNFGLGELIRRCYRHRRRYPRP